MSIHCSAEKSGQRKIICIVASVAVLAGALACAEKLNVAVTCWFVAIIFISMVLTCHSLGNLFRAETISCFVPQHLAVPAA